MLVRIRNVIFIVCVVFDKDISTSKSISIQLLEFKSLIFCYRIEAKNLFAFKFSIRKGESTVSIMLKNICMVNNRQKLKLLFEFVIYYVIYFKLYIVCVILYYFN